MIGSFETIRNRRQLGLFRIFGQFSGNSIFVETISQKLADPGLFCASLATPDPRHRLKSN